MKNNKNLTVTARYASINAHLGFEQSRRDDCESIMYVLIYFARPGLPWQGVEAKTKEEKFKLIMDMKRSLAPEKICKNCPSEFIEGLTYIKELKYEEEPSYNRLISLMVSVFRNNNFIDDGKFDWNELDDVYIIKESTKNDPLKSLLKRKGMRPLPQKTKSKIK